MRTRLVALLALAWATGAAAEPTAAAAQYFSVSAAASILGVSLAAGACGIAMGLCITAALNGIARQPEITARLQINMMIGLAFIESLVLYTLFIAIILVFANPFARYFAG